MSNPSETKHATPLYRYRFGAAEFDEAQLELKVSGLPVDIEQRPLQVLAFLLRHCGEVVTKEELLERIWDGRPTVDNVLANAIAKLRKALGPVESEQVLTVPRVGYRLHATVERMAVGRRLDSRLNLGTGSVVPHRHNFVLETQLGPSRDSEVWLARHMKTDERRVYKFSADGGRLALLKREATLYRVVTESLGEREDFARILDWNFESPPYFLECAYGGPNLADWAARPAAPLQALTAEDRLSLFLQIADAVAAAHSVGVLHKDLKPSNVLIAPADDRKDGWQIRLTDFGSGRLLEPGRLQELGITQLGLTQTDGFDSDSSGTLLYIAPEILSGAGPTVQSDVYALGILLYQLVTGDLRRPMTPGWERNIADALLREDIAAATDGTPQNRLVSAADLAARLRRRDARAAEQATRQAALADAATAQRVLERTRARRPWVIAALAMLTVGLGVSLWFYRASRESERRLTQQVLVAEALNGFMTHDLIGAANPAVSGHADVRVIDAAKAAIPRIDSAFSAQAPEIQAALHAALQDALTGLTESEAALSEGRKALAAYGRIAPPDRLGADRVRLKMVRDLARVGRLDEVPPLLAAVERDLPSLTEKRPVLQVEFLEMRATYKANRGDQDGSLVDDENSWRLLQSMRNVPADLHDRVEFNLADSLTMVGRFKESEAFLRDLIVRQSQTLGPEHQQIHYTSVVLANNLIQQHRFAEAQTILAPAVSGLEAALGPTHGRTLLAKRVIGLAALNAEDFSRAEEIFGSLYATLAKQFGETYSGTVATLETYAVAKKRNGDLNGAEKLLRQALSHARDRPDPNIAQTQHIQYYLADLLLDVRRPQEVAGLLADLKIEILRQTEVSPDWPARLDYQAGRLALSSGDRATARAHLTRAREELPNPGQKLWNDLSNQLQAALQAVEL